jgi:3-deoxy-D-manno-octulosonate 8-phosphate phosphatase (KDO 8-P phosphatase)
VKDIRAFAFDFDGVLTEGGFWWGEDGQELKRLSFRDVMGLSLARRAGLHLGLISGEDSPLLDRYAEKLSIPFVAKGCKDKAEALRSFAHQCGLRVEDTGFMGDDVNDLGALALAGYAAAPADAHPAVLRQATFTSRFPGGQGAVREVLDLWLQAQPQP